MFSASPSPPINPCCLKKIPAECGWGCGKGRIHLSEDLGRFLRGCEMTLALEDDSDEDGACREERV